MYHFHPLGNIKQQLCVLGSYGRRLIMVFLGQQEIFLELG